MTGLIPPPTRWQRIGAGLRQMREDAGVSLEHLATEVSRGQRMHCTAWDLVELEAGRLERADIAIAARWVLEQEINRRREAR